MPMFHYSVSSMKMGFIWCLRSPLFMLIFSIAGYTKVANKCVLPCEAQNYCSGHGICSGQQRSAWVCSCFVGWTGKTCQFRQCYDLVCKNDGNCTVVNNTYKCSCAAPYTGLFCERKMNCRDDKAKFWCYNQGECLESPDDIFCICLSEYYGQRCEHRKQFIKKMPREIL